MNQIARVILLAIMVGLLLGVAHLFDTANARAAGPVVVYEVRMDNCPTCVKMEKTVEAFRRAGYPLFIKDVVRDAPWIAANRVGQTPTFLAFRDGREIERRVGVLSVDELTAMFRLRKRSQ